MNREHRDAETPATIDNTDEWYQTSGREKNGGLWEKGSGENAPERQGVRNSELNGP